MRHPHCGLCQAVVFGNVMPRHGIDPMAEPGNPSVSQWSFERRAGKAEARKVTGPDDPIPAKQGVELGIKGASHVSSIQYVGTYYQVTVTCIQIGGVGVNCSELFHDVKAAAGPGALSGGFVGTGLGKRISRLRSVGCCDS